MAAGNVDGCGGRPVLVVEEDMDMPCSPRNKMKFLCSHGGKILLRPTDGHLKYVGGETRVVAVPRDITFSELKEKLSDLFEGEMVLKYQLIPEDLDTLISVKTDEDLKHMLHEYNRHENQGSSPKLRAFLFPSKPTVAHENQPAFVEPPPPHLLEQRYIDAINGVVWAARRPKSTPIFSISSACSSPMSNSPEFHPVESAAHDALPPCHIGSSSVSVGTNLHRVQSSPSLYRPSSPQSHCIQQHHYPLHQIPQQHLHHGYQSSKSLVDHQKPPVNERLSIGRAEFRRGFLGHGLDHCYTSFRHHNVSGGFDDFSNLHGASHRIERAESLPRSPRKKLWE